MLVCWQLRLPVLHNCIAYMTASVNPFQSQLVHCLVTLTDQAVWQAYACVMS